MYVLTDDEGRAFGPRWTNLDDVPERLRGDVFIVDKIPLNCLDALPSTTKEVTLILKDGPYGSKVVIRTNLADLWSNISDVLVTFDVRVIQIKSFVVASSSDEDIEFDFTNPCYSANKDDALECDTRLVEHRFFYSDASPELCGGGRVPPLRGMEILMILSCMWEKIRPHTKG